MSKSGFCGVGMMVEDISELLGDVEVFLDAVFLDLSLSGIDVEEMYLDHICYRVETQEEYCRYKEQLQELGVLLAEAEIGGRPIATYRLRQPISYNDRDIYCVELPAPKEGSHFNKGLEHVEFVTDKDLADFVADYPMKVFDIKGILNLINPVVKIKYRGFVVKFHNMSIEKVIQKQMSG